MNDEARKKSPYIRHIQLSCERIYLLPEGGGNVISGDDSARPSFKQLET